MQQCVMLFRIFGTWSSSIFGPWSSSIFGPWSSGTLFIFRAAKEGLAITLMERTLALYKDRVMRMLIVQYRMNDVIMQWSSDQLYDGKLVAHESVAKHLLRYVP